MRWTSYVGLAVTTVDIVPPAFPTGAEIDGVALWKTVAGTAIVLAAGLDSSGWAYRHAEALHR